MRAYRDQYASVFRGGRGITVIGVSPDPIEELASWAKDEDFPFLFASDPTGGSIEAFGGEIRESGMTTDRSVVVVAPGGTVHRWIQRFREIDPTAYGELRDIVMEVAPEIPDGDEDVDAAAQAEAVVQLMQAMEAGSC